MDDPVDRVTAGDARRAQILAELSTELADFTSTVRRIIARTAEQVSPGMSPALFEIFAFIADEEQASPTRIAATLRLDKAVVSRGLASLEASGLIERTGSSVDRRSVSVAATRYGRDRLDAARAARERRGERILDAWPTDDLAVCTAILRDLRGGAVTER